MSTRCILVSLIGAPNVGKSTLLNRLVGAKVSIVTPKVQTTRSRVVGIALRNTTQIIFFDTPGIFRPKKRMQRAMVEAAWASASQSDKIVLVIDSQKGLSEETYEVIKKLKKLKLPSTVILNKIDLIHPTESLALISSLNEEQLFTDIFIVSALTGEGVDKFLNKLESDGLLGPWLYPEDQVSDVPVAMFASEVTREKLFMQLHNELPYSSTIATEEWINQKDGSVRIEQTIYVERQSQKLIVVGKKGQRIKLIGKAARHELERILDRRVHLFLRVKVREDWSENPEHFNRMGLDFNV